MAKTLTSCKFNSVFAKQNCFIERNFQRNVGPHRLAYRVLPCSLYTSWASEKGNHLKEATSKHWNNFYTKYEEFVGLTDVQHAQMEVRKAEKKFLQARTDERAVMRDVLAIRDKLKHIRERLSHVNYSNPLYPQLANEQHELVTEEEKMKNQMDTVEERERDTFLELSAAMRDSYEKERARVERTKNWSLIGSVIGTLIGMLGSSYINRVRTKDLQQMIKDRDHNEEIKDKIAEVVPPLQSQYSDIKEDITQLQVCLINKLLDPLPHATKQSSPATTSMGNGSESESINQVLQNFHSELSTILEDSSENQDNLATKISMLINQIKSLEISKDTDAVIFKEIRKINEKLDKINRLITSTDIQTNQRPETETPDSISDHLNEEMMKEIPSSRHPANDIIIWGLVLSAVYYILCV